MKEFRIPRDNADQRALQFRGQLIAEIYGCEEITRLYTDYDGGFIREHITLYLRTARSHASPAGWANR